MQTHALPCKIMLVVQTHEDNPDDPIGELELVGQLAQLVLLAQYVFAGQ